MYFPHRGHVTALVAITAAHDARSVFHALEDRGSPGSAMLTILAPGPGGIRADGEGYAT
jgi:hypothetical protein